MLSRNQNLVAVCTIVIVPVAVYILTKLLLEAWVFVTWCLINYAASNYFFYDAQYCFNKAITLSNQANEKLNKGVFSFFWGEIKNSTMTKVMEEDRKFRYLWPKAYRQRAAFVFFSSVIFLVYSTSTITIAVLSAVVGLGYLTKPELQSLPIGNKDQTDVLYFDYFAASGAIVLDGIEKHNYYIGVFYQWFLIPKKTEKSQPAPSNSIDDVETSKTVDKNVEKQRNTKNEHATFKSIANRSLLLLK